MAAAEVSRKRTTRRRGDVLVAAIREAVRAELADHGYAGVTFEGVARRAHTSKPVLYSRYRSRAHLVADALVTELRIAELDATTGSLRGDLLRTFELLLAPSRRVGPATLRALMGDADDELLAEMGMLGNSPARASLARVVVAAQERGELGPAPIPETALHAPMEALQSGTLMESVSPERVEAVIDDVALPLYRVWSAAQTD